MQHKFTDRNLVLLCGGRPNKSGIDMHIWKLAAGNPVVPFQEESIQWPISIMTAFGKPKSLCTK